MSLFLYQQSLQSIGEVKVKPLSFTLLQPSPIKGLNILMLTHIRMVGGTPLQSEWSAKFSHLGWERSLCFYGNDRESGSLRIFVLNKKVESKK